METRTDLSSYLSPAQHNLRYFLCGTIAKRAWAIRTASLPVHSARLPSERRITEIVINLSAVGHVFRTHISATFTFRTYISAFVTSWTSLCASGASRAWRQPRWRLNYQFTSCTLCTSRRMGRKIYFSWLIAYVLLRSQLVSSHDSRWD